MNKPPTTTKITKVLSSKLRVDSYQRPLNESRVTAIVKAFNPDLVNYIKCSVRTNGDLYIFDGIHTRAALERRNDGRPVMAECRIYEFSGYDDVERHDIEAILFAQQNGISRQVAIGSRLRAEYLVGSKKALAFHEASNTPVLGMDFTKSAGDGKISCVAEAYRAWNSLGDKMYSEMLRIIVKSWGGERDSLRSEIIGGMALFMKKYDGTYAPDRLIKCLSNVSPMQIIRNGNLISDYGKSKYASQIVKIYNKGMQKKLVSSH